MKSLILFLFVIMYCNLYSQDTTDIVDYYDGSRSFNLITARDTSLVWLYPGRKKELVCKFSNYEANGTYTRWYKNGRVMWRKEMKNGLEDGKAVYYDEKGVKVAELIFSAGQISDTVFINEKNHLVFGKITFESTVSGGAVREDGSSNVSRSSGPYTQCAMYAAGLDSVKKAVLLSHFKTDFMGQFFIVVPECLIGFYPASVKIESLAPGLSAIPQSVTGSTISAWREDGPWKVGKNDKILQVKLHHVSHGYAP